MNSYQRVIDLFHDNIDINMQTLDELAETIFHASELLANCLLSDGKILCCGEGQSGALSQIFSSNLVNRFDYERPSLPAISLASDATLLSALAADSSFNDVFAKQIRALGLPGDTLIIIANGGASGTILQSIQAAHDRDMAVIALSRASNTDISSLMTPEDIDLLIPSTNRARVVEAQLLVLNTLCDLIDIQLFGHEEDIL